jgi:hypothetical protein
MTYADAKNVYVEGFDIKDGLAEAQETKKQIQKLGTVNLAAIEDIKTISERYEELTKQRKKWQEFPCHFLLFKLRIYLLTNLALYSNVHR